MFRMIQIHLLSSWSTTTMAKRYWPQKDAVGQQIVIGKGLGPKFEDKPRTIIGVFADTRDDDLAQVPVPNDGRSPTRRRRMDSLISCHSSAPYGGWFVQTWSRTSSSQLSQRNCIQQAGAEPWAECRPWMTCSQRSIATQNFNMLLLSIFASTALLLAAIGIYGVTAYSVAQRTHEVGVRMALGADRISVRNMILWEGLMKGTLGVISGICAAFFLARLLATLLYGVSSHDAAVFVAAPLILELIIAIATFIPAQRAANLDPASALRFE